MTRTTDMTRPLASGIERGVGLLAGIVVAHGVFALFGWWAGWPLFTRPSQHLIPMAPSTALAFAVLGLAVLTCVIWARRAGALVTVALAAWMIAGVAVLNLAFPARLDEMLGGAAGTFGRVRLGVMSPVTAGALLLLSVAIGLLQRRGLYASVCATLAAVLGATVAFGYLYGAPLLYGSSTIPVALPTGLSFLLLGCAVVASAGTGVWPLQPLVGPSARARMLRAFLPATAGLVVFIGLLEARFGDSYSAKRVLVTVWLAVVGVALVALIVSRLARRIGGALDQAYADRHRAEQRYREVFEQMLAGVATTTLDGRFLLCNDAFARMFGYQSPEKLVGQQATNLYWETEDRDRMLAALRETGELRNLDLRMRRRDGEPVWILANLTLRNGPDGDSQIDHTVIDISSRKALEQQLRQSQKLDALGSLAGGVAHDFNNLLTAILGSADLALDTLKAGAPEREEVEEIRKAALRAADLTRQLLAFSRQQLIAPTVLNPNSVVAATDKLLRRLIGEDVELRAALAPNLGAVKADAGQLEQVILNLAVNARDAMPNGGQLTIETQNVELDEVYIRGHVSAQPGRYIMIAVSDTGTGMDAATQARIFEPFFTTKETGKGTGLGLATVYGIVKQSGGWVGVYSEPGLGTSFKIYLPRVAETAAPLAPSPAPPVSVRGSETVLLVEDEEQVRQLVKKVLKANGYTVLEAATGLDAERVAGEHAAPIHLLMTDVVLPGLNGRQVAERLTTARPGIRVLYLSGYMDDAIVHHGVLEPGVAFLQKPFSPAVLGRKVREVLDRPAQ